jgi:hypothetical protein
MDERKKTLGDLEAGKHEKQHAGDVLLRALGGRLAERARNAAALPLDIQKDIAAYQSAAENIAAAEEGIRQVGESVLRLREAEAEIEQREKEYRQRNTELDALYAVLGRLVLEDAALSASSPEKKAPYEILKAKIQETERSLNEIENRKNGTFFSWIGKTASGVMKKTALSKDRERLTRLSAEAGAAFAAGEGNAGDNTEVSGKLNETAFMIKLTEELRARLSECKRGKDAITESFRPEGSAEKKSAAYTSRINSLREEQDAVCLRIGRRLAEGETALASYMQPEDREALERAVEIKNAISDIDSRMEKLKASLAIDEERAVIEKKEKTIKELRFHIAQATSKIKTAEQEIGDSNKRIAEWMKV